MGQIFDRLIELNKKEKPKELNRLLKDCALFEMPFCFKDMISKLMTEKKFTQKQYIDYLQDFFDESKEHDQYFLMPYPTTAIEDQKGIMIYKNIEYNIFKAVMFGPYEDFGDVYSKATVTHRYHGENSRIDLDIQDFIIQDKKGFVKIDPKMTKDLDYDFSNWFNSTLEQTIYIMDPENFIVKVETDNYKANQKKLDNKPSKKRNQLKNKPQKTRLRPYYLLFEEENLKYHFSKEYTGSIAPHPVRGHWRRLTSDFFKNKKGKRIFVKQHFRGEKTISLEDKTYSIILKEENGKLYI